MKYFFLILIFLSIFFTGCETNDDSFTEEPDLPKIETFFLDIKTLDSNLITGNNNQFSNWQNAVSIINIWKNLIKDNIKTPYNALFDIKNMPAEFFADNTWLRDVNFIYDSIKYQIKLYSTYEADSSVLWEMFVSGDNITEYLAVKGSNNKYYTQGSWMFNKYVISNLNILSVDWLKTDTSLLVDYYIFYQNHDFLKSKLSVNYLNEFANQKKYNILIDFFNSNTELTTKIHIDTATNSGRILDSLIYEDTNWHYWNESLMNTNNPN